MTMQPLAALDFDRYAAAVNDLLSAAVALEFHVDDTAYFSSRSPGHALTRADIDFDADDASWTMLTGGLRSRSLPGSEQLFALDLYTRADRGIGTLVLRLATGMRTTDAESVGSIMRTIASWLCSEYELNDELDLMAREVVERYEELNLVYDTEDNIHYFVEGSKALEQLTDNCVEYLNVGMALLLLPDKAIHIVRTNTRLRINGEDAIVRHLENRVYPWMIVNAASAVINGPNASDDADLWPSLPVKVVASPVVDGKGGVSGLLAIVNPAHRDDFNSGDRNLLTVMAGKASKIIQSNYDSLTGLMTRDGFEHALFAALSSIRQRVGDYCVMHVNIDRIHLVNDTLGHRAGDDLLRRVAQLFRDNLRDSDCVARLGGDDFGILLEGCALDRAQNVAEKFRGLIGELNCSAGAHRLDVSASIGVAPLDAGAESIVQAMAAAEIACSAAKDLGRNRCYLYTAEDEDVVLRRQQMHWVGRLQRAMRNDSFELYGQLIAPLSDPDGAWHFEILLRMQGPDDTILPPGDFLPVAERYHLMPALDRWVIEHALEQIGAYAKQMIATGTVCTINVSGQSLTDAGLAEFVLRCIETSGLPASSICFEITETAAIGNINDAKGFIASLKARGCQFSLDDFGAGLSSFGYLKTLDVDYLKIDGCFVRDILEDSVSASMVAAINQVGQIMGLATIGEFVENEQIRQRLATLGVDYVQGWGIARPRPIADLLGDLFAEPLASGL